nr:MAG TPA_asm: BppU domain protein [Caudoviricetes sp.]
MQTIYLDFQSQGVPPVVPVMQSDSRSRFVGIVLYNGGVPYEAPSGANYTVQYRSTVKHSFGWYDTIQDSSGSRKAITQDGSSPHILTVELAEQALRVPGDVLVNLCVLTESGYQLSTFPFVARVTGVSYPDDVAVQSYLMVAGGSSASWMTYVTACLKAQQEAEEAVSQAQAASENAQRARSDLESAVEKTETAASDAAKAVEQVKIIANGAQGWFDTAAALKAALPTGEKGQWAVVGETGSIWIWSPDTGSWKDAAVSVDFSDYYTKSQADAAFALKPATTTTLGGVKVGDNLSIDASGRLSGAAPYVLPAATTSTLGGVKAGSNLTVYADGTLALEKSGVTGALGYTPAQVTAGTYDLTAGSSYLATGTLYVQYDTSTSDAAVDDTDIHMPEDESAQDGESAEADEEVQA